MRAAHFSAQQVAIPGRIGETFTARLRDTDATRICSCAALPAFGFRKPLEGMRRRFERKARGKMEGVPLSPEGFPSLPPFGRTPYELHVSSEHHTGRLPAVSGLPPRREGPRQVLGVFPRNPANRGIRHSLRAQAGGTRPRAAGRHRAARRLRLQDRREPGA